MLHPDTFELDDAACQKLIMSLAVLRGEECFTEDEARQVLNWAQECIDMYEFLALVLEGEKIIEVSHRGTHLVDPTDEQKDQIRYYFRRIDGDTSGLP